MRRSELKGKERTEDGASDRLRWKSVKLAKVTQRAAEATKRERGDTAQSSGAMSRNAKTLEGSQGWWRNTQGRPGQVRCTLGLNLECGKRTRMEDLLRGPQ